MKEKTKKRLSRVLIGILVIISLLMIFNRQIKSWLVSQYNPFISEKIVKNNLNKKASFDYSSVKELDWKTVLEAKASEKRIKVIGEILYPSVKMHLPIGKGIDNYTLALAAGTLKSNQRMGKDNYALAGHNMVNKKILFGPLYAKAKIGQKVYITDEKNIYEYKIYERKFIKPTDVQYVNNIPHKKIITLITCDATGAGRLMLRGKFVKKMNHKKAPEKIQKGFEKDFNR